MVHDLGRWIIIFHTLLSKNNSLGVFHSLSPFLPPPPKSGSVDPASPYIIAVP